MPVGHVAQRAHGRLANVLLVLGTGLEHGAQQDLDAVELDEAQLVRVAVAREVGEDAGGARAHVDVGVGGEEVDEPPDQAVQVVLAERAVRQVAQREQAVVDDAVVVGRVLQVGRQHLHGATLHQHLLVGRANAEHLWRELRGN